ncbi:MAG: hypothetical protein UX26_C0018G0011 [Parcubacteria group bacterium GW2011_GWC1_45_9]|nr:MAG: hypothetical protein UW85_C0002G0031 [Parcubacteria group bacterium GW2011_GWA1_Parcubacteria_45_10]KKU16689.1 MAG: hypothetical protein UX26_C0018G0011 [Parcubacteria group bacterium GW2011_GWC1_45_9]HCI05424.1 hypothetical protein [Patescibacteria group bacterium]
MENQNKGRQTEINSPFVFFPVGNIILIMEEKDLKTLIQKEIDDFEFNWLDAVLKFGISRDDMLGLLDKFEIRFFGENWRNEVSQEDMANVLTGDDFSTEEEQIWAVRDILNIKHPDKLSFEEAKNLYQRIWYGDFEKMYDIIMSSPEFSEFIKDSIVNNRREKNPVEIFWHKKDFIVWPFLEEIYKLSKQQIKELFG